MPIRKKSLVKSTKATKTAKAGKLKGSASKGSKTVNLALRKGGDTPVKYL